MENLELNEVVRLLPKVDLHRHLEGSIRLATLSELVKLLDLDLPSEPEALRSHVQIQAGEPCTAAHFLSKFKVLRQFYRSAQVVERITTEAIEDAAADGIRHLELRFTPVALSNSGAFPLSEVVLWVIQAASRAAERQGVSVGLIASINRHEPVELAQQVAQLAITHREAGIVGLGLAGDERIDPSEELTSILQQAKRDGLDLTIHAGEWTEPVSVRFAMEVLGAARIGHGIRVMEDPDLVRMARDTHTVFEICLTSNVQSGAVPSLQNHPFPRMIEAGLQVTLNSDDPGISDISLSDEYLTAIDSFDLSLETLRGLILAGAQAAFLPAKSKDQLEKTLMETFF